MAVKEELLDIAAALDAKNTRLPALLSVVDEKRRFEFRRKGDEGESYTAIAEKLLKADVAKPCLRSVVRCFEELGRTQNGRLWNAFARGNNELKIEVSKASNQSGTSGVECEIAHILFDKQLKQPVDRWEMEAVLEYNRAEVFEDSLHHELGHWLDDSHYSFAPGEAQPVQREGMHSDTPVWKKLVELDNAIYPYSEATPTQSESEAISKNLRELRNYSTRQSRWVRPREWEEEFFAQMAARYFGPALGQGVKSPLFQMYISNILDFDAGIMMQDKPAAEIQADREKLYLALKQPLERYFDMDKLDALMSQWKELRAARPGDTNPTYAAEEAAFEQHRQKMTLNKKLVIEGVESCIGQGLSRLFRDVGSEVRLPFADGVRSKAGFPLPLEGGGSGRG